MITLYTKPDCQPCRATKRALTEAGIPFTVIDLTEDADAMQRITALGYRQAPVVVAGDQHWSGFQPAKIKALREGQG